MDLKNSLTDPKVFSLTEKEEKKSDSSDIIFLPQYSKIPPILKRILDIAGLRHSQLAELNASESSVQSLLSLDYLSEVLAKDSNLKESDKSVQSVNQALKQMLDTFSNGKEKLGYLYPILFNENNHVISKILVIAPQKEKETFIKPFRNNCFDFSKKVIEQILNTRQKQRNPVFDTEEISLIMQQKEGSSWFYPKLISFENEIVHLIKKAFQPYSYIPNYDFISDFIKFGMKTEKILEITHDYHIIDEKIEFTEIGEFKRTPEILIHYKTQINSLQNFIFRFVIPLAEKNGYSVFLAKIENFRKKFDYKVSNNLDEIKTREEEIASLINTLPIQLDENTKKCFDLIQESIKICKRFYLIAEGLDELKEKNLSNLFLTSIQKKIDDHTKEKSTLFVLDIKSTLNKSGIENKQLLYELEKELKHEINDKYGYFEATSGDGKQFFYVTNPGYITQVIHNLTKLSIENSSYKKQLDIANLIHDRLRQTKPSLIDSGISEVQKTKYLFQIDEMYAEQERLRKKEDLKNSFNILAGVFGFVLSLFYFMVLYKNYSELIYLLLAIPVSLVVGFIFSILFRKKPFFTKIVEEVSSGEEENQNQNTENQNLIVKASENYIFSPRFTSIDERIFDRHSLKQTIISNLEVIKSNSPLLAKEKNDDKIISTVENAMLFHSALINVPNDLIPKGKSNLIILNRTDLKSPHIRNQIAEYFKFQAAAGANNGSQGYYNFLYQAVERDYFKYVKGNNISKLKK